MFCRILIAASLLSFGTVPTFAAERPSLYHEFAHVADGGSIRTSFLILNPGSSRADVFFDFFQDDGSPWEFAIQGAVGSRLSWQIEARGMIRITSDGATESPRQGWARMTSSRLVGAHSYFEIFEKGQLVTQATVPSSGPMRDADLFIEESAGTATGLALANLSSKGPTRVTLTLRDETGQTTALLPLVLGPNTHRARFLCQFFPDLEAFRGTLTIRASGPIAVLSLQQTGLVIGTLPVVIHDF